MDIEKGVKNNGKPYIAFDTNDGDRVTLSESLSQLRIAIKTDTNKEFAYLNKEHVEVLLPYLQGFVATVSLQEPEQKEEAPSSTHYKSMAIEPLAYIEANHIGFHAGNVIKYVSRYKSKNGLDDLQKAKFYIERLIELEEGYKVPGFLPDKEELLQKIGEISIKEAYGSKRLEEAIELLEEWQAVMRKRTIPNNGTDAYYVIEIDNKTDVFLGKKEGKNE